MIHPEDNNYAAYFSTISNFLNKIIAE